MAGTGEPATRAARFGEPMRSSLYSTRLASPAQARAASSAESVSGAATEATITAERPPTRLGEGFSPRAQPAGPFYRGRGSSPTGVRHVSSDRSQPRAPHASGGDRLPLPPLHEAPGQGLQAHPRDGARPRAAEDHVRRPEVETRPRSSSRPDGAEPGRRPRAPPGGLPQERKEQPADGGGGPRREAPFPGADADGPEPERAVEGHGGGEVTAERLEVAAHDAEVPAGDGARQGLRRPDPSQVLDRPREEDEEPLEDVLDPPAGDGLPEDPAGEVDDRDGVVRGDRSRGVVERLAVGAEADGACPEVSHEGAHARKGSGIPFDREQDAAKGRAGGIGEAPERVDRGHARAAAAGGGEDGGREEPARVDDGRSAGEGSGPREPEGDVGDRGVGDREEDDSGAFEGPHRVAEGPAPGQARRATSRGVGPAREGDLAARAGEGLPHRRGDGAGPDEGDAAVRPSSHRPGRPHPPPRGSGPPAGRGSAAGSSPRSPAPPR